MISVPLAERWRPMWNPDAHPERPWWRRTNLSVVRCDGAFPADAISVEYDRAEPWWAWDGIESYTDFMARIDREHPLPAPPPLPGQVWAWSETEMAMIVYLQAGLWYWSVTPVPVQKAATEALHRRQLPFRLTPEVQDYAWPPPGGILVAGPTPWGRDCPWMAT